MFIREQRKIIPAPFTKGVNFTNWLKYRPAEEIDENYMTQQDFKNAAKLGCVSDIASQRYSCCARALRANIISQKS